MPTGFGMTVSAMPVSFLHGCGHPLGCLPLQAAAFWLLLAINVIVARRLEPRGFAGTAIEEIATALRLRITAIILFLGAIVALIVGASTSGAWETVLLYLNHGNFNLTDPIFNRDVSFFVFTLPFGKGCAPGSLWRHSSP